MNKQLIGAPCPECGEPVKALFDAFELAETEIYHENNKDKCSVPNDLYRAWAAAIENGEREEMQLTADFVKEALAEYSKRAGEILDKPRSENDGALLLKMRRKWLIETLLEFGNCFMPRDNQSFINQAFDWMGIAIDLQQKLKAAMEKITALENGASGGARAVSRSERGNAVSG